MKDLTTIRERLCRELATSGFIPAAKWIAGLTEPEFAGLVREAQAHV